MRKIFFIFYIIIALNVNAQEIENFCSAKKAQKTFSGNIASLSGFNALSRNITENILEKTIKKETEAKFKIKINNFYYFFFNFLTFFGT